MPTAHDLLKAVWNSAPTRLVRAIANRFRSHDAIYSRAYYERHVESTTLSSAEVIVPSIVEAFTPASVIDVGCGTGIMLAKFRDLGISALEGLEYSQAALEFCASRNLTVRKFDLESDDYRVSRRFDLALSMEVAEHLPESVADRYVKLLTECSDLVVMTAAHPGQGGTDHVNEQPRSYWVDKFRRLGYQDRESEAGALMARWQASGVVADWYYRNLMVFRRG